MFYIPKSQEAGSTLVCRSDSCILRTLYIVSVPSVSCSNLHLTGEKLCRDLTVDNISHHLSWGHKLKDGERGPKEDKQLPDVDYQIRRQVGNDALKIQKQTPDSREGMIGHRKEQDYACSP